MASLRLAKAAGVRMVMFTSDNFNKYPEASELLQRMIDERLRMPFFIQCDTQIAHQAELVDLLSRAGCFQMFVGVESFSRKTLLAAHKAQNHPELYSDIVRLCRERGIITHFSNIIGFPSDTHESLEEHLDVLIRVRPDCASFYILTPVPGTQQYDEFLRDGWITEPNLDRYDATCTTWRHPVLQPEELRSTLFSAYRRFYSARQLLSVGLDSLRPRPVHAGIVPFIGVPLFSRFSAWKEMHPMSGGVGRIHRDAYSDYRQLRRKRYGYDLVPLPKSLELSAADEALNKMGRAI
jgi:radical SAM superfamily enzyme YgiQ (UPF0313 family)